MFDTTADQQAGARFLAKSRAAMLADVPGLGKTAQLVRALDALNVKSANIIVPNRVLALNTQREFEKWSVQGLEAYPVLSEKDEIPLSGIVTLSYALAIRPAVFKRLMKRQVDVLACDEAHRLKQSGAEGTKRILRKTGLAGRAQRVWLMTGTPAPNHAGELYVFAKLCGAWTGTRNQFEERFCITRENHFGSQVVGSKNHAELKALLAPYLLRRTQVEGRPALVVDQIPVEATGPDPFAKLEPEHRAAIDLAISSGDWSFGDFLALATVRRLVGIAKAESAAEIAVSAFESGHSKIIVACQHTAVIEKIASKLDRYGVEVFDGATPQRKRLGIVDAFQSDGGPRVIVGQIKAMGEGITLTAASRIIIAEPSWTPADNDQVIARPWRRGQKNPVHASMLSLSGSVDDAITRALVRKSNDIAQLI